MLSHSKKVLIIVALLAAVSVSCKKKAEVKYTEKLDMNWELIKEWKMVNIETKEGAHRFTYVPDHNEVNPQRYVIIMQNPVEKYPALLKALQKIDTAEPRPDFCFKKSDFSGEHEKQLYIVKIKNRTTVQGVIKGNESFILINYTDYLFEPDQKFVDEWVNRWQKTRIIAD